MRGEVFRLRPKRRRQGHEQQGPRYAVIVQADELLSLSTVLVAPTSTRATPTLWRPTIELDGISTLVLPEQISVVDTDRLGASAGRLSAEELRHLDAAIARVLGLI